MNARSRLTDAAWVLVESELEPAALAAFCQDVERLFRANPLLEVKTWRAAGADCFDVVLKNLSTAFELGTRLRIDRAASAVTVHYASGLKRRTRFEIEAMPRGSRLTIIDDYSGVTPDDARARSAEVDRSLTVWGHALHAFLKNEKRWGRYALWRWWSRQVWLRMTPSARRITYMLLAITAVEIAAIAVGVIMFSA
jgi:hypothetical protein